MFSVKPKKEIHKTWSVQTCGLGKLLKITIMNRNYHNHNHYHIIFYPYHYFQITIIFLWKQVGFCKDRANLPKAVHFLHGLCLQAAIQKICKNIIGNQYWSAFPSFLFWVSIEGLEKSSFKNNWVLTRNDSNHWLRSVIRSLKLPTSYPWFSSLSLSYTTFSLSYTTF